MANILYNQGIKDLLTGATAIDTATYKALLERSTSTYTPNKDDDNIGAMTGLVEVSVASYARVTITTPTLTVQDGSDNVKIDFDDVNFGTLEAAQTVKSVIVYRHVGADGVNIPLARIDTDSGSLLPRALGGGNFTIQINASGFATAAQA